MRNVIGLLKHIHNDLGNAALTTKNTNILVKQLYKHAFSFCAFRFYYFWMTRQLLS